MSVSLQTKALLDAVHLVKGKLARLPAFDAQNRQPFDSAVQGICNHLVSIGAVIGERHDGHFIRFCRLRATATAGRHEALQNWVAAAYRKLDQEAVQS
jgi:hypothetical protein